MNPVILYSLIVFSH